MARFLRKVCFCNLATHAPFGVLGGIGSLFLNGLLSNLGSLFLGGFILMDGSPSILGLHQTLGSLLRLGFLSYSGFRFLRRRPAKPLPGYVCAMTVLADDERLACRQTFKSPPAQPEVLKEYLDHLPHRRSMSA